MEYIRTCDNCGFTCYDEDLEFFEGYEVINLPDKYIKLCNDCEKIYLYDYLMPNHYPKNATYLIKNKNTDIIKVIGSEELVNYSKDDNMYGIYTYEKCELKDINFDSWGVEWYKSIKELKNGIENDDCIEDLFDLDVDEWYATKDYFEHKIDDCKDKIDEYKDKIKECNTKIDDINNNKY